jgi:hypothetical protein
MTALSGFGVKKTSITKNIISDDSLCKCGSTATYTTCCKPFHGNPNSIYTPHDLIKSRYSAYATDNMEFIVTTTSTTSPDYIHYLATNPTKDKAFKRYVFNNAMTHMRVFLCNYNLEFMRFLNSILILYSL